MADEVKARRVLVKGREMTAVEEATRLHSVWRAAAAAAMSLLGVGGRGERLLMSMMMMVVRGVVVGKEGWQQARQQKEA